MAASARSHPLAENAGYSLSGTASHECVPLRASVTLPADHELNDTIALFKLPADAKILDCMLVASDLDSNGAPAIALDLGVIDTVQDPSDTTDVDALLDGVTVGQTGGIARMTLATGYRVAVRPYDRTIRLLIATGAATAQAGQVDVVVWVSPKQANGNDNAVTIAT
jgi:hypothetical protein